MLANLRQTTPWTVIALLGLLVLAGVDYWRDLGPSEFDLLRGVLPNFAAVFVLTFGFLMIKYPVRDVYSESRVADISRMFWRILALVTLVLIGWEFIQKLGSLVFDWLDIAATFAGSVCVVPVFYMFLQRSFDRVAS